MEIIIYISFYGFASFRVVFCYYNRKKIEMVGFDFYMRSEDFVVIWIYFFLICFLFKISVVVKISDNIVFFNFNIKRKIDDGWIIFEKFGFMWCYFNNFISKYFSIFECRSK